jgi:tRNA(adenine34) deaminase
MGLKSKTKTMPLTVFSDEYYMKQAYQEAEKALEADEIPIGAVVVCNNKIIARAHNQTETLNDVTAHAEMLAITAAANALGAKYLDECTLYVTLEPCPMCAGAILNARLDTVVYGAPNPKAGCCGSVLPLFHEKFNHHPAVFGGVLEAECASVLGAFFRPQ